MTPGQAGSSDSELSASSWRSDISPPQLARTPHLKHSQSAGRLVGPYGAPSKSSVFECTDGEGGLGRLVGLMVALISKLAVRCAGPRPIQEELQPTLA